MRHVCRLAPQTSPDRSWYRFRCALGATLGVLALSLSLASTARAVPGFGLGPVIAITASDTPALGWELTVVGSNPVYARAALGGSYSWSVAEGDPRHFHYLVLEPWLYHEHRNFGSDFPPEDLLRWERRFLD